MGNRIYVGNLSFNTDEQSLGDAFAQFGDVSDVKVIMDRDTGRSRGFAFVTMADPEGARRAISQMDGATVDGRTLRVNEAEERQQNAGRPRPQGGGRSRSNGAGW